MKANSTRIPRQVIMCPSEGTVVVTNQDGEVLSQFKNTKANTQQRVDNGKWVPKPKPESQ
jgi:hypothetical protein